MGANEGKTHKIKQMAEELKLEVFEDKLSSLKGRSSTEPELQAGRELLTMGDLAPGDYFRLASDLPVSIVVEDESREGTKVKFFCTRELRLRWYHETIAILKMENPNTTCDELIKYKEEDERVKDKSVKASKEK